MNIESLASQAQVLEELLSLNRALEVLEKRRDMWDAKLDGLGFCAYLCGTRGRIIDLLNNIELRIVKKSCRYSSLAKQYYAFLL